MINYKDLEMALDFVSAGEMFDSSAYINRETGQVYCISDAMDEGYPEDIEENQKYEEVPHKREFGLGRPLALEFSEHHLSGEMGLIYKIFSSRGAYSRFKELLEANALLENWYEYEADAIKKALLQWSKEIGVEVSN